MSRLLILTTHEMAVGYRLAGAAAIEVASTEETTTTLEELLATEDGVIAIHAPFFHALPRSLLAHLDSINAPLVVSIPAGTLAEHGVDRRQRLLELLRQAVGYQITFGGEGTAP
jgi:vacuolar-type H+-ATPase subunit F/Vma7